MKKTAHLIPATLIAVLTASAQAATDDVGGPGAGMMLMMYVYGALFVILLPALYMLFGPGRPSVNRLAWLLGLAAIDLGSVGMLAMTFLNGHGGDVFLSPIPWVFVVLPGFVLAYCYRMRVNDADDDQPNA